MKTSKEIEDKTISIESLSVNLTCLFSFLKLLISDMFLFM